MRGPVTAITLVLGLALCDAGCQGEGPQDSPVPDTHPADLAGDTPESDSTIVIDHAFPEGFLWGVALSAFQTEGHVSNDYTDWISAEGRSPDYGQACNSWELWQEDIDLAASLGVKVFRTGIEWARIEPERDAWDETAVNHYRQVFAAVREAGMEPLITLHHYTNPSWLADLGYWAADEVVAEFEEYATLAATRLGDLVDLWNPQNEPMIYITGFALVRTYPGSHWGDYDLLRTVYRNDVLANARAYDALHQHDLVDADGDGQSAVVWAVHAASPIYPDDVNSAESISAAERYDYFWNQAFLDALVLGRLDLDFDGDLDDTVDSVPEGVREDLRGRLDGIGLNYYSRTFVHPMRGVIPEVDAFPCISVFTCGDPGPLAGDNDTEVYPLGLYEAVEDMSRYELPMMVTENGVADRDDDLRPAFLVAHLVELQRAIADGHDVRGYLHWSLLDNYEWLSGYDMRFGLVEVDYDTFERTPRPSADLYQTIVVQNGLDGAMVASYPLPGEEESEGDEGY